MFFHEKLIIVHKSINYLHFMESECFKLKIETFVFCKKLVTLHQNTWCRIAEGSERNGPIISSLNKGKSYYSQKSLSTSKTTRCHKPIRAECRYLTASYCAIHGHCLALQGNARPSTLRMSDQHTKALQQRLQPGVEHRQSVPQTSTTCDYCLAVVAELGSTGKNKLWFTLH
jgi:hypothetical protein